jgi:molecular chaperone GrpE (heat shock protein)
MESAEVGDESFVDAGGSDPGESSAGQIDPDERQVNPPSKSDTDSVPSSVDSDEGTNAASTPSGGSETTAEPTSPAVPASEGDTDREAEAEPPVPEAAAADEIPSAAAEAASKVDLEKEPASAADPALASASALILERMQAIHGDVVELFAVEQRHTGIIEKLHAENTTLRQGELVQAIKPLLLDLARLYDDVASLISHGGEALRKAAVIPDLIVDVLSRHGVTPIIPSPGEAFTAKQHQAVETVETDDPARDGTISDVRRPGFLRDGEHLVRPAHVNVYRYVGPVAPPTSNPTTPENESNG